ncbi:MAG TPA: FHA domain-containing protein, partial [Ktedonobacterales bacterium]|nr:FHA domain-containing protein [Ktedonobacterales bacterium]
MFTYADFPTWFAIGVYGGLTCSLLSGGALAWYALTRRQGTQRQLAASLLVCLVASCLLFAPIWWAQNRLGLYGPTLSLAEVTLALVSVAILGWLAPLSMLVSYIALAAPPPTQARRYQAFPGEGLLIAALNDPARQRDPLGAGQAWGWLTPLDDLTAPRAIPLTQELILLGREGDNDIIIEDTDISRHHAEIHWDHGHPQVKDRGSTNNTLLNHQAVRGRMPLRTGDILQFGERRYRFEALEADEAARLAADARQQSISAEETRKVRRTTSPTHENGQHTQNGAGAPEGQPGQPDTSEQSAPLPVAPTLELVAIAGPTPGARWPLHDSVMTIGRDQECAITLPDSSVSRQHAQIMRQPAGF